VVCNYAGDSLKVVFCSDSLLSILENIRSERVTMRISCNTRPVIIEPEPQSLLFNMLYLIMPMAYKV
jgi:DNA polymerase III sliding clamp (beta) subunit (PCNA family)